MTLHKVGEGVHRQKNMDVGSGYRRYGRRHGCELQLLALAT
ncbi:hypothetical protein [Acidithiobacillus thiooxidans]|nr:hypothetical protein [Acidithiobacillus thiooxidans]